MVELVYQKDNRFAQLLRIAEMILSTYLRDRIVRSAAG